MEPWLASEGFWERDNTLSRNAAPSCLPMPWGPRRAELRAPCSAQSSHCSSSSCTLPSQKKDKTPAAQTPQTPVLHPCFSPAASICLFPASWEHSAIRWRCSPAGASSAQSLLLNQNLPLSPVPSPVPCASTALSPSPSPRPAPPNPGVREGQRCFSNKQLPQPSPGSSGISFSKGSVLQNLHEGKEPELSGQRTFMVCTRQRE